MRQVDPPFSARRGFTHPSGKLGDNLGCLKVTVETEEKLRAAAAAVDLPVMEFVRELIEIGFQGRSGIERQYTTRLDGIEPYAVRINGMKSRK